MIIKQEANGCIVEVDREDSINTPHPAPIPEEKSLKEILLSKGIITEEDFKL